MCLQSIPSVPDNLIVDEEDFFEGHSPVGSDNNNINEYGEEHNYTSNNPAEYEQQHFQNQYSNEVEYQDNELEEEPELQNDESALHT